MKQRFLEAKLHISFLKKVFTPGLLCFVCFKVGEAIPSKLNYDLLFNFMGIILAFLTFFTTVKWLARAIAIVFFKQEPNLDEGQSLRASEAVGPHGISRELILASLERQQRNLAASVSSSANSLATFSRLGHRMEVLLDSSSVVFQFYELDPEPLRPQSFSISARKLGEVVNKLEQMEAVAIQRGSDSLLLSAAKATTEDRYGSHFKVSCDENLLISLKKAQQSFPEGMSAEDELKSVLADLKAEKRGRFDPAVDAALLELREFDDLEPLVKPILSGNTHEALFAASFLFDRTEKKQQIVEAMLRIVERELPSSEREAAESTLLVSFAKDESTMTNEALSRLVRAIPWNGSVRSIGSALRPLEVAGTRLAPFVEELETHRAAVTEGVEQSRRPEAGHVLDVYREILKTAKET